MPSRLLRPAIELCGALEVRRPRLRGARPGLDGRLQPRRVVQRTGLDEQHLREHRGDAVERRATVRAEVALRLATVILAGGRERGERAARDAERRAGTPTSTENGLPVWRWQSVQWQTAYRRPTGKISAAVESQGSNQLDPDLEDQQVVLVPLPHRFASPNRRRRRRVDRPGRCDRSGDGDAKRGRSRTVRALIPLRFAADPCPRS